MDSVGRAVARAEAGAAEALPYNHPCGGQLSQRPVSGELQPSWHGAGVDAHGERSVSGAFSLENVRYCHDIIKGAARAACHDALVYINLTVAVQLAHQIHARVSGNLTVGPFFRHMEDIPGVGL